MQLRYLKKSFTICAMQRLQLFRHCFRSQVELKISVQNYFFGLLFLPLILSGCGSINEVIKAKPAASAGFLPAPELLSEMRKRYPFHGAWMNMDAKNFHDYKSIYVAPMDTTRLAENGWWEKANLSADTMEKDAANFARETEVIFRESFVEGMKLAVANEPGPGTVVLELSIVELTPAKVWLSAIGLASFVAPVIVGIPAGTAAALGQNGTVAIEGIMRDGETNEILLMFADREASKIRILDFKTLTWYGHAHEIMEDWSHQLMELLTTPHDHMVPDSDGFAWAPF